MIVPPMRIAFLDCVAGVAGDMWVAALLDAGLDLVALQSLVGSLGIPGVEVGVERVRRAGLAATRFKVANASQVVPRHLPEIRGLVARAAVPEPVRGRALAVFDALAAVEAEAHGIPVDQVHFHELGAVDTVVDVLCACLGVELLGIERIHASAVEVGSGVVQCEHGLLPVPAPGTLGNLLGVPITRSRRGECTTPTGAALLRVLCHGFEPPASPFVPERIGHGAGARDTPGAPNVLRVTIGRADPLRGAVGSLLEIACNVDTASGELLAWLIDGALSRGAVDAWAVPATMKKGRPAHVLSALVPEPERDAVIAFLLEESTSLGVRINRVGREVLERWEETVATTLGPVRQKCVRLPSGAVVRRPEDDELRRLAAATGLSRRELLARLAGG